MTDISGEFPVSLPQEVNLEKKKKEAVESPRRGFLKTAGNLFKGAAVAGVAAKAVEINADLDPSHINGYDADFYLYPEDHRYGPDTAAVRPDLDYFMREIQNVDFVKEEASTLKIDGEAMLFNKLTSKAEGLVSPVFHDEVLKKLANAHTEILLPDVFIGHIEKLESNEADEIRKYFLGVVDAGLLMATSNKVEQVLKEKHNVIMHDEEDNTFSAKVLRGLSRREFLRGGLKAAAVYLLAPRIASNISNLNKIKSK
jgi:hypothetical protein